MDEDEVTAYKCGICGALYSDEEEGTGCHGNAEPISAWACGRCGTVYETRDEARKCCSAL